MAKRNRKKKDDFLRDHHEWVNHMYNPGYWINRVSWAKKAEWRLVGQNYRMYGVGGLLLTGIILFSVGFVIYEDTKSLSGVLDVLVLRGEFWGLMLFVAFSIALLFQKPEAPEEKQVPPPRKVKKKKQPRRRKDYR